MSELTPKFDDRYSEEAWIIGNGPSLAKIDLNLLCDRTTYAMQRIHLMYDKFSWRPTYYVMFDRSRPSVPHQWKSDLEFHSQQGYPCYARSDMFNQLWVKYNDSKIVYDNIIFLPLCEHSNGRDQIRHPERPTEWHLPRVCKYGGSAFVAIQLAVMRGAKRIFLLGCDLGYGGDIKLNHFSREYIPVDSYTEDFARLTNATMEDAHKIAKMECEKRGAKIYNATPGGFLGVHPRRDFHECVSFSK